MYLIFQYEVNNHYKGVANVACNSMESLTLCHHSQKVVIFSDFK
jgi:hypothetical protein